MNNTLTIVIPTQGRVTLKRCLDSLKKENQGNSKAYAVHVVADTASDLKMDVESLVKSYVDRDIYYSEHNAYTHNWGYPQLQYAYEHVFTNYVMNIGDDDIMEPNIIPQILKELNSGFQPYLFRAIMHPSPNRGNDKPTTLWTEKGRLERQHVTGQNFICPVVGGKMGFWWDDFSQLEATIRLWDNKVKWIDDIIVQCY